jgi:hypothetical protein
MHSFPAFAYGQQDNPPRVPATAPPSRPPSRVNIHEQPETAGFESASVTAAQGSAGEECTHLDRPGRKMLIFGGTKATRLLHRD